METEKGMTLMETQTESRPVSARPTGANERSKLIEQYGCGPVQLTGTNDALYERHLVFDNVMDAAAIGARERFEAIARSVRDVLSQRWIRTEETYDRKDPKRVYYLSMEFLIGRSLANNATKLIHDDVSKKTFRRKRSIGTSYWSRSPTLAWAMEGSGVWRPASSIRWLRWKFRPWGMASAINTVCSSKPSRTGGNTKFQTTGCVVLTRGRSVVKTRQ